MKLTYLFYFKKKTRSFVVFHDSRYFAALEDLA